VPKKVLGRGLGELLPEQREGGQRGNSPGGQPKSGNEKPGAELGPGLRVLVLDKGGTAGPRASGTVSVQRESSVVLKLSLLAADAALLVTLLLWWKRVERPLSVSHATAVILVVVLGAWLGSLAAWLQFRRR
jgi:hypothetical protein